MASEAELKDEDPNFELAAYFLMDQHEIEELEAKTKEELEKEPPTDNVDEGLENQPPNDLVKPSIKSAKRKTKRAKAVVKGPPAAKNGYTPTEGGGGATGTIYSVNGGKVLSFGGNTYARNRQGRKLMYVVKVNKS